MKKLFTAIRKKDNETVKELIKSRPELVNCTAKQPPKKDDGQSPLQVAIKTQNFEIADFLIDSGADVNFIEGDDSLDDWRMPVLNMAVLCAVMLCRHETRLELEDRIMITEHSSKEEADASYYILKKLLVSGADVNKTESRGTTCAERFCISAQEILPHYSWDTRTVSYKENVITDDLASDLGRISALLKEYRADFNTDRINACKKTGNHPLIEFI